MRAITQFAANNLISPIESFAALQAESTGSRDHTIGYELEVMPDAAKELPEVMEMILEEPTGSIVPIVETMAFFDYSVATDGEYELVSPAAKHPLPLSIATKGVVRLGFLPETPKGMVTAHVSIGTSKDIKVADNTGTGRRLINLLRAVELAGGSSSERLLEPITESGKDKMKPMAHTKYSWNEKGRFGLNICGLANGCRWEGSNKRIEFRSLMYKSPLQFEEVLSNLYFLSRGLLAEPGEPGHDTYREFEEYFDEYRAENGMPEMSKLAPGLRHRYSVAGIENLIAPYAEKLQDGPDSEVESQIALTLLKLHEEFDIPGIHSMAV